jgi:hypothetical protein
VSIQPGCREPSGLLPTRQWSPRMGLTLRLGWEPSPPAASLIVVAAVLPACHKERSLAVCNGKSRSLPGLPCAGR